jgi:hypothetical protein
MAEELNIARSAGLAARVYQTRLRLQAPVKTGALKRSVEVVPLMTGDGFVLKETFLQYGIYTDSGTGRYYKPNKKAKWNPRPGRGRGGIKPRYWTNISDQFTLRRITEILTKDIVKQIKRQLGNYNK